MQKSLLSSPRVISTVAVAAIIVVVLVAFLLAFFVIRADNLGTRFLHVAFILFPVGAVMLIVGALIGLSSLSRNGFVRSNSEEGSRQLGPDGYLTDGTSSGSTRRNDDDQDDAQ